jgi:hypothetical protein
MMGGLYGRTVVVVVGKGNNGADGRMAARLLADQGVRVHVLDAQQMPLRLPVSDLIIDAAFGTGFRGEWNPPATHGVPVLAVDIPSGVDGLTGLAIGDTWQAARTVTFVALKPGLLLGVGRALSVDIELIDIGERLLKVKDGNINPEEVKFILAIHYLQAIQQQLIGKDEGMKKFKVQLAELSRDYPQSLKPMTLEALSAGL